MNELFAPAGFRTDSEIMQPANKWSARLVLGLTLLAAGHPAAFGQVAPRVGPSPSLEGRFRSPYYHTGVFPGSVLLADLNNDGSADMVSAARTDAGQPAIRVRFGAGDGTFGPRVDHPAFSFASSIAAGDINRDGWLDLLVGFSGGNGDAAVYLNNTRNASPVFDSWTPYRASLTKSVALAHLNDDPYLDHVFATERGSVEIFWGRDQTTPTPDSTGIPATGPIGVLVADMNADSRLDIVTVGTAGAVDVIENRGEMDFVRMPALEVGANKQPRHVAVGEINGDGRPDIVTSNFIDGSVTVFESLGQPFQFRAGVCYSLRFGSRPMGLALRDLNGDWLDEIAVTLENNELLAILENTKQGEFVTGIEIVVDYEPNVVTISDLDGDSCPDILVGSGQAGTDRGGVTVMVNVSCAPSPGCPSDLNGDGFVNTLDLVLFIGDFGTTCGARSRSTSTHED